MKQMILESLADNNRSFIHGLGERGTDILFQIIDFKGDDSVLEIGFGIGASMVKLKANIQISMCMALKFCKTCT